MHRSPRVLAILALLSCAGNTVSAFKDGYTHQSKHPRALLLPQQRNVTTLPSSVMYLNHRQYEEYHSHMLQTAQYSTGPLVISYVFHPRVSQSESLTSAGDAHGVYLLSSYTEVRIF